MDGLLSPAAGGPEEVGGVLEVGPHREDLMDEVLHADDVELAQALALSCYIQLLFHGRQLQ